MSELNAPLPPIPLDDVGVSLKIQTGAFTALRYSPATGLPGLLRHYILFLETVDGQPSMNAATVLQVFLLTLSGPLLKEARTYVEGKEDEYKEAHAASGNEATRTVTSPTKRGNFLVSRNAPAFSPPAPLDVVRHLLCFMESSEYHRKLHLEQFVMNTAAESIKGASNTASRFGMKMLINAFERALEIGIALGLESKPDGSVKYAQWLLSCVPPAMRTSLPRVSDSLDDLVTVLVEWATTAERVSAVGGLPGAQPHSVAALAPEPSLNLSGPSLEQTLSISEDTLAMQSIRASIAAAEGDPHSFLSTISSITGVPRLTEMSRSQFLPVVAAVNAALGAASPVAFVNAIQHILPDHISRETRHSTTESRSWDLTSLDKKSLDKRRKTEKRVRSLRNNPPGDSSDDSEENDESDHDEEPPAKRKRRLSSKARAAASLSRDDVVNIIQATSSAILGATPSRAAAPAHTRPLPGTNRMSTLRCYGCDQPGHFRRECPNNASAPGTSSRPPPSVDHCTFCKRSGHVIGDCAERLRLSCTDCGENGHTATRCPRQTCKYCQKRGHAESVCRRKRIDQKNGNRV